MTDTPKKTTTRTSLIPTDDDVPTELNAKEGTTFYSATDIRNAALEEAAQACQNQLIHIAPDEGGGVLLPTMVEPYDAGCNDCIAAILDLINQPEKEPK